MQEPIRVRLTVQPGEQAQPVYESVDGVPVEVVEGGYIASDGRSYLDGLPVVVVDGPITDGGIPALAVSGMGPAPDAPVNTAPPEITGTVEVGETLTATAGTWTGATSYAYQWRADESNISGATSSTYTLQAGDDGAMIDVRVTATGAGGSASELAEAVGPVTTPAAAPVNTVAPSISGSPYVGVELTATAGTWTGAESYAYAWLADGEPISGATSSTYTVQAGDRGAALSVRVTATGPGGSTPATSAPTTAVTYAPPVNTVLPSISGTLIVGETLTATAGTWTGADSYAYQWFAEGDAISGATSSTYVVAAAVVGDRIRVRVTASNADASTPATSAYTVAATVPTNTAPPEITGTVEVGETLTVTPGTWTGSPSLAYQWRADSVDITGATTSTYELQAGDDGAMIDVRETASWTGGSASELADAVGPVTGGEPSIVEQIATMLANTPKAAWWRMTDTATIVMDGNNAILVPDASGNNNDLTLSGFELTTDPESRVCMDFGPTANYGMYNTMLHADIATAFVQIVFREQGTGRFIILNSTQAGVDSARFRIGAFDGQAQGTFHVNNDDGQTGAYIYNRSVGTDFVIHGFLDFAADRLDGWANGVLVEEWDTASTNPTPNTASLLAEVGGLSNDGASACYIYDIILMPFIPDAGQLAILETYAAQVLGAE